MTPHGDVLANIDELAQLMKSADITFQHSAGSDVILVTSQVAGERCDLEILWPRGSSTLHMQQRLPITVTAERYVDIAVALLEINAALMTPGLVLDESGRICFRLVVICDGSVRIAASQVRAGMAICIQAAEHTCGELRARMAGEASTSIAGQPSAAALGAGRWWADDDDSAT